MMRNRRAVSEIISTVLIILIISVLGSYLYSVSINIFHVQQDSFLNDQEILVNRAQERYRVVAVWWNGNDNFLNVTVYNYGDREIKISDVYVNGVRTNSFSFGQNQSIPTGTILNIGFTSPVALVAGSSYKINFVSDQGVTIIHVWES